MPNRAEILKQKFQNSLALPFEQVLTQEVIQPGTRAGELSPNDLYPYRDAVGMDVASARPGQKLKPHRRTSDCLVE